MSLLLAHPDIDVNCKDKKGFTPWFLSTRLKNFEFIKLLMNDKRVDVNQPHPDTGRSVFELAYLAEWVHSFSNFVIRWLVALRGNELVIDRRVRMHSDTLRPEMTITEFTLEVQDSITRSFGKNPEDDRERQILLDLGKDRPRAIARVRRELGGFPECGVADLFACVIFFADDFLREAAPSVHSDGSVAVSQVRRFFCMVRRLPMELQMMICNRAFELAGDIVLTKDSELAFKDLARVFCPPRN
jgi:hypothetical protein